MADFIQDGASIDYTPGADVAAGDVIVQGDLVGVARGPIKSGQLGVLAVEGVFDFTKNTGVAYTAGQLLYWDDTNNVVTDTATGNKQIGKAIRAAASGDTTARVRLNQ